MSLMHDGSEGKVKVSLTVSNSNEGTKKIGQNASIIVMVIE